MIRYVVSRLVVSVAMVLLATLVIFLIANTVPGDPVLTAARRHGGLRPGAGGGVPRPMGPRPAAVAAILAVPRTAGAWRSRRLDLLAPAGAAGHHRLRPRDPRARDRRLHPFPPGRPAARRAGGGAARQLDRSCRPCGLADRRLGADLLAGLHCARGLLRRAELGAGPGAARPGRLSARPHHRTAADRHRAGRRLGDVPRRRGASGAAVDRARRGHAGPDHPHHARRDARGAVAGLCARRARQGPARAADRRRPCAAQRACCRW